jgi:hypothetical protein
MSRDGGAVKAWAAGLREKRPDGEEKFSSEEAPGFSSEVPVEAESPVAGEGTVPLASAEVRVYRQTG